jgi:hypothetical protein
MRAFLRKMRAVLPNQCRLTYRGFIDPPASLASDVADVSRLASSSILAGGILTEAHKRQILHMFLAGTQAISNKIDRKVKGGTPCGPLVRLAAYQSIARVQWS